MAGTNRDLEVAIRRIEDALERFIVPIVNCNKPNPNLNDAANRQRKILLYGVSNSAAHAAIILRDALALLKKEDRRMVTCSYLPHNDPRHLGAHLQSEHCIAPKEADSDNHYIGRDGTRLSYLRTGWVETRPRYP